MAQAVVVKHVKHNDVPRIFKKVAARAERTGAGYGVERAMHYVPIDTGKLRLSIKVIGNDAYGSDVRYAKYVEDGSGRGPARWYMRKSADDVADEMPNIIRKEFRRWAFG